MQNRKKSLYNVIFGIGSQVLSIALGIVIPRLFLLNFGSEMNGFLSSLSQIMVYFALLEAGVGAASLQALYGPVGKGDRKGISAILAAAGRYYRKTALFYLIAVIGLAVIYPLAIPMDIPLPTAVLIILFNGIPGVISYYFQGKYLILLNAEGKNYILTILTTVSTTLTSLIKIVLLLLKCDILLIQFSYLLIHLLRIVYMAFYIRRSYGWIDLSVEPDYQAISQKNAALVGHVCDMIFRNTDTIVLAVFCDLKVVSVYAMYTMLFSMVRTALDYVAQGFSFILGQTYHRDFPRFVRLYDLYETYRTALIFALYTIAYIFILPFMKLYTAGITDINYVDGHISFLFVAFYMLTGARACASDLINYAQHFRQTQSRCIIEAAVNLLVSLVAVQFLGIYGVLLGTIVALLYRMNDMLIYANKRLLHRSPWNSYKRVLIDFALFILISTLGKIMPWHLEGYVPIIAWACISGLIICAVFFAAASLTNPNEFKLLRELAGPTASSFLKRTKK